jgi:LacI family transcriptional regulator
VPIVFVDRAVDGMAAPVVRAEGSRAIAALVDHLVDLGHERIAVITGPRRSPTGRERLTAFRTAMRAHSLDLPRELVRFGNFQADSGRRAAAQLLDLDDPPTAVFAIDSPMAMGALQELRRRGLRIGSDIAVSGFDDPPWFQLLDPPMTTVSQPVSRMGALAAEMLVDAIGGGPAGSHLLDCELVVRASCGEATISR